MATYTSSSTKRSTYKDASTADTYIVDSDSKGLTLVTSLGGNKIVFNGLASDYNFKAVGKTLTITNLEDSGQVVKVQLKAGVADTLSFLDGDVAATYTAAAGKTKATLKLTTTTDTVTLTTKKVELAETFAPTTSTTAIDQFDTSGSGSGGSGSTGSTFTLTSSIDGISGSANNDTISGLVGVSGTYNAGDNIAGNSGTDTLNLIVTSGDAVGGLVSLDGVETVNVRLVGTAATATVLNAGDWSGVTTLTNASSMADTILQVTGVEVATNVTLYGNTDINIGFANSTTAASAVNATLISAGNFGTATTLASASAAATANLDLDLANAGLITAVNVALQGTSLARLEAGSSVTSYTLTGTGGGVLVTDDTVTTFNASALSAALDVTFSGASEVTVTGGSGNDIIRFGTTLSNSDSVNGGAGTDTVVATIGGFSRGLNTSNVESAEITFNDDGGGTLNATGSTLTTYTLGAGSAGADANIAGVLTGATINLTTADNFDAVTLDAASGAAAMTVNVGSASGNTTFSAFAVTDVAAVTVVAATNSTGTNALGIVDLSDSDIKSVTIRTTGGTGSDADLTITNLKVAGATAVSITSNGSAGITLTSGLEDAANLVSLVAIANDSASIVLDKIGASATAAGITTISLTGNGSADITTDTITLATQATAAGSAAITLNASGNGSIVGTTATDITVSGGFALTMNITAGESGQVLLGDIAMQTGNTAQTAASSAISLVFGNMSVGANGVVLVEEINLFAATAGATLTVGTINVGTGGGVFLASGGVSAGTIADVDVSIGTITLAADASATFGAISTISGAVGSLTVVAADSASAAFGAITASSLAAVSLTLAGDAEADFTSLTIGSNIESISISLTGDADATLGAISAGGDVGAITIGGVVSATANFGIIEASSIASITVSGAGFVDFGTISAAAIAGGINASQMTSGTFNIDLSKVVAAVEVNAGLATNTIISGLGNDTITLKTGSTANDNIEFTTATQGTDTIAGFFAGSTGGDKIMFATGFVGASGGIIVGSAFATDGTTVVVESATTASGAITISSGVSVVLVGATAFASTAAMVSAVATGGSLEINLAAGGGGATAGSLVVVWTDGTDSYVSLVGVTAAASGTNALIENGSALSTVTVLQGVTPAALVAANFDFV